MKNIKCRIFSPQTPKGAFAASIVNTRIWRKSPSELVPNLFREDLGVINNGMIAFLLIACLL